MAATGGEELWLHSADDDSITLRWAPALGAVGYALQWRPAGTEQEWTCASDQLQSCTARKKR